MRGSSTSCSPTSRPPWINRLTCGGAPTSAAARSKSAWQATAVNGVSSEGFHTTVSPQTRAIAVFHDQTATGKLNAEMTPTTPSGCQDSMRRCPARSEAMVLPYSCRESPTANWQMSIISCTSPRASETIFPASMVTNSARSFLCSTSSSPRRATNAPRMGPGVVRHCENAWAASAIAVSTSSFELAVRMKSVSPVMGVRTVTPWSPTGGSVLSSTSAPIQRSAFCALVRNSSADGSTPGEGAGSVVVIGSLLS
ncbi:Uncharacterised protein [Mycobacteroides abscessus subsp. abscessus]|nr:Uncharacterised protein [Mycobacteroides abscessus subsp. abscessus]